MAPRPAGPNRRAHCVTCDGCQRVFELQNRCPGCGLRISVKNLVGRRYLLFRQDFAPPQRLRLLREMRLDLLRLWIGTSRQRRRIALIAKGLPPYFELPPLPEWARGLRPRATYRPQAFERYEQNSSKGGPRLRLSGSESSSTARLSAIEQATHAHTHRNAAMPAPAPLTITCPQPNCRREYPVQIECPHCGWMQPPWKFSPREVFGLAKEVRTELQKLHDREARTILTMSKGDLKAFIGTNQFRRKRVRRALQRRGMYK